MAKKKIRSDATRRAFNEWLKTEIGKQCLEGHDHFPFWKNGLTTAFEAGFNAALEIVNGQQGKKK